jgi:hypothetical protein
MHLLAELPASCRALALGGDAVAALGTLGRVCGLGLQPEDGGANLCLRLKQLLRSHACVASAVWQVCLMWNASHGRHTVLSSANKSFISECACA